MNKIDIADFKDTCNSEKKQLHIFDLDGRKTIYIIKSRKYYDLTLFILLSFFFFLLELF